MSSMIQLENIKRTADYIEADYNLGYDEKHGVIRLKISDGKIERAGDYGYGISHAESALKELAKKESVPSEYTVCWY